MFLVRDPQAVVASFNRHDVGEYTKSTLHTNVYLWLTHLLSLYVFLQQPRARRLLVRYEDFVADPGAVVRQILDGSGAAATSLPDFTSLHTGFPLQGNRVSRSDTLSLKPTADPLPRSSPVTRLVQAPLMAALARLRPTSKRSQAR